MVVPSLKEYGRVAGHGQPGRGEVQEEAVELLRDAVACLSLLDHDAEVVHYILGGLLHVDHQEQDGVRLREREEFDELVDAGVGRDDRELVEHELFGVGED